MRNDGVGKCTTTSARPSPTPYPYKLPFPIPHTTGGECANGTRVIATLNGVRLRNPRIDQPPNAQPGQFHMHVSNLRLLRDAAQDAEVCFSLSGTCR